MRGPMNKPVRELSKHIGKPAANALLGAGITTLRQAQQMSDKELLALHGVGPKAVKILREYIKNLT